MHAEQAYFDGIPVLHVAAWHEKRRLERIEAQCRAAVSRNRARSGQNFGRKS